MTDRQPALHALRRRSLAAFDGDALRVQVQQTIVLFSLERRKSVAIPDHLRQRLSLFLAEAPTQ
ncbi:MAG: hypothetical protein EPN57_23075 [Paraburkholderia sp.]|nr:MAG: hypothetical protein EPN57_23075 [Paraburkholderia sp.]